MSKSFRADKVQMQTGFANYAIVTLITLFVLFIASVGAVGAAKIVDKQYLVQKAKDKGEVRVIIQFEVADTQMSASPASDSRIVFPGAANAKKALQDDILQSHKIQNAADSVLARLEKSNYKINKRMKHIPFIALSVKEKALEKLETITEILSVVEDLPIPSPQPPASLEPGSIRVPGLDAQIGAESGWAMGYTGSGWYVAILDTGIRASHEMFAGKSIVESCFSTNDAVSGALSACPNGSDILVGPGAAAPVASAYTPYGHGTHVAGIAAGQATDVQGVAIDAGIIAVQVFSRFEDSPFCGGGDCLMSYVSDQTRALDWVYEMRHTYPVAAVNMSLGGGNFEVACDNDSRKAAIDNLAAAGIAVVVSSGNSYQCDGVGAPACISSSVSVGAIENGDLMADFSNWSDNGMVDLMAPGIIIMSAVASGDADYAAWNGTSMAAPFATGAWAMLKQKRPEAGVDELLAILQATADDVLIRCNWATVDRHIRVDGALTQLNRSPQASAGDDVTVAEGSHVTLDGGNSRDPDRNDALIYEWSGPPDIQLSNSNAVQAHFTAPQVAGEDRILEFELTVQDNQQGVSTDSVRITVTDPAPWVDTGGDQSANEGERVTLDGSGSSDVGDPVGTLTFDWHQIGGTRVTLDNASTAVASFTAPMVGQAGETLTFRLAVTDAEGQTGIGTCTVTVFDVGTPPVADAGADRLLPEGVDVTLDGSGSTDVDGSDDIESYHWVQIDGPAVALQDIDRSQAFFSIPPEGMAGQSLAFELTITDRSGLRDSDTCIVTVKHTNQYPVSDAGFDQVALEGATVRLSGVYSQDPDADPLDFHWTQIGGQPQVVLSDAASVRPTFVCSLPSDSDRVTLQFQLSVTDPYGLVSTDDVQVLIEDNQISGFPDTAVTTQASSGTLGVFTDSQGQLVKLDIVEKDSLPLSASDPKDYPFGLLDLAVKVPVEGMATTVTVQFEEPLPMQTVWMKYNPNRGWEDYSGKVVFSNNNTLAEIQLVDGGIGDDDGIANGIIVDPSGPAVPTATDSPTSSGSGGGGCFITTVREP